MTNLLATEKDLLIFKQIAAESVVAKYATKLITSLSIQSFEPDKDAVYTSLIQASLIIPEGWERDIYMEFIRRKSK